MKKRQAMIGGVWVISTSAAFFIGQSHSSNSAATQMDEKNAHNPHTIIRNERTTKGAGNHTFSHPSSPRRSSLPPSAEDLPKFIENIANISDPIERAQAFLEMIENLSPGDFERVVHSFRELNMTRQRRGEYALLLSGWAKADPLGALSYAKENTETPFARQTILATWAEDSPQQALAWARENFEGEDGAANPWIAGVIRGLANTDLSLATSLLHELPYSRERRVALTPILNTLKQRGIDDSKQWISSLEDESLQAGAVSRIIDTIAKDDPEGALNWVTSLGEEALKRSAKDIVESWAQEDLNAARAWTDQQSNEIRATAATSLIQEMAPEEASSWLSSYEGDPAYDNTIKTFVRSNIELTPELSADWIMKITNERDRNRTFSRVIGDWYQTDPDGLIDYAQNNVIPETALNRLNSIIKKANGG